MFTLVVTATLTAPGVAPPESPPWMVRVGLTGEQVGEWTTSLKVRGYRPISISACNAVEANRYAVVYQKRRGPGLGHGLGTVAGAVRRAVEVLSAKGYVTACLSGCNQLGAERLSDLWVETARRCPRGDLWGRRRRPDRATQPDAVARIPPPGDLQLPGQRRQRLRRHLGEGRPDLGSEVRPVRASAARRDGRPVRRAATAPSRSAGSTPAGSSATAPSGKSAKGPPGRFATPRRRTTSSPPPARWRRGIDPTAVVGYNTPQGDRFASLWEKDASGR